MYSHRQIAAMKGLSDAKVDKLTEAALKLVEPVYRFQTAKDVQCKRDDLVAKITTGCKEMDDMLSGGIE